eukprot:MONOS_4740.1-p1 / transcript=MONOS_4740.1 / gene=MONOS_4740 / organism=Monocercomonoides_exilis_PA203 / gene_product=cathepsin B11 cysteine protease / transcript_product=cathepsin B11 cysteine protease / location=Mono_scaffold00130:46923-48315(-) / protein_length=232 / sequence_SO=supercontig / SO=protein_coding / is_pseudo=false
MEELPSCKSLHTIRSFGACPASWLFAANDAYADSLCYKKNISVLPSVQLQLNCDNDCAPHPYEKICEDGCLAGSLFTAVTWLGKRGIVSEECLPFEYKKMECTYKCKDENVPFKSYTHLCQASVKKPTVDKMKQALKQYGSLVVGMNILPSFWTYKSGIITTGGKVIDPYIALRIVGWGENESGEKYWIVQNNWGDSWGMQGRAFVKMGVNLGSIESEFYFFAPCEDFEWN